MCVFLFGSENVSDEYFMLEAMKEANKAYKKGDVPVGAVIVYNNIIIARGYNQKENKKNPVLHAEIVAIQKACKKLNNWHLDECTLYVTLEPCLMCAGAIVQSRIKRLVYATSSPKFGYIESVDKIQNNKNNHIPKITSNICAEASNNLLKNFFKNKRRKL